jgi:hypothetical protein
MNLITEGIGYSIYSLGREWSNNIPEKNGTQNNVDN